MGTWFLNNPLTLGGYAEIPLEHSQAIFWSLFHHEKSGTKLQIIYYSLLHLSSSMF